MRFVFLLILSFFSTAAFADDSSYETGCTTLNASQQKLSETSKVQGRYYWIDEGDVTSTYGRDFIVDRQTFYERASASGKWTAKLLQYDKSDGRPLRSKCRLTSAASSEANTETWEYVQYRPNSKTAFSCTIVIEKPSNLPMTKRCNRIEPTGGVRDVTIWTYRSDVSPPDLGKSPG